MTVGRSAILKVFFDPACRRHNTGPGHPERYERVAAFVQGLEAGGVSSSSFSRAQPACIEDACAVHSRHYLELAREVCRRLAPGLVGDLPTGDTVVCRESFDAALAAAGGALAAARDATATTPALAACRPPGHHAEPSRGMGFCLINNVAVAGAWARREQGPVLIADFDYHHGNGTQAWVERELERGADGIGFISTHAYPAYPGTGAFGESHVEGRGFVLDIPLTHQTDGDTFLAVWQSLLPAAARRLRPSSILVSAGFDFLAGDPIAGLPIGPQTVRPLCSLFAVTARESGAALVFILEGGYSLANMRAAGAALAEGVSASSQPPPSLLRHDHVRRMCDQVVRWLAD